MTVWAPFTRIHVNARLLLAGIREYHTKENMELCKSLKKNPKGFWARFKKSDKKCELQDIEGTVGYFNRIVNVDTGGSAILDDPPTVTHGLVPQQISDDQLRLAEGLNLPFNETEICHALDKLGNGKATVNGLPSELFKYAKVEREEGKG